MQKVLGLILTFTILAVCMFSQPTLAKEDNVNNKEHEKSKYVYKVNDCDITSNVPLTKSEVEALYNTTVQNSNNDVGTITPYAIPSPDYTGTIVDGPYNRTFDHKTEAYIASHLAGFISYSWVPGGRVIKSVTSWIAGDLLDWGIKALTKVTYESVWISRAYDSYTKHYWYYDTLVNYSDRTFTKPKHVDYFRRGIAD